MTSSFHDGNDGLRVRNGAGVSKVNIDVIIGIMMDKTIAFNITNDTFCTAASSCDTNDVDLHHPLHLIVDAWEYVVGLTMYRRRDGIWGVRGAREA
jgi:hypothetical protein